MISVFRHWFATNRRLVYSFHKVPRGLIRSYKILKYFLRYEKAPQDSQGLKRPHNISQDHKVPLKLIWFHHAAKRPHKLSQGLATYDRILQQSPARFNEVSHNCEGSHRISQGRCHRITRGLQGFTKSHKVLHAVTRSTEVKKPHYGRKHSQILTIHHPIPHFLAFIHSIGYLQGIVSFITIVGEAGCWRG